MNQNTLSSSFMLSGVGIHSGAACRIHVFPAPPDSGRVFLRNNTRVPAQARYVVDTTRSTTLGLDGEHVSTVEHLLSALAGAGIDNALIEVDGPEIPILDGSALPFLEAIGSAGIAGQDALAKHVRVPETKKLTQGSSEIIAEPGDVFSLTVTTEFEEWPGGAATITLDNAAGGLALVYAEAIAPARTFAFRREVEMLLAAGLAKGGSLDNALIISPPDQFSSPLRVPSEWCAHKALDVIGDLALLDARPLMKVFARRPGHRLNTQFAKFVNDSRANP